MDERQWYKGDTHLHTLNSDGVLTKGQLVDKCKQSGLDFMIITDHNFNSVEKTYFDKDMLVIQGQEITGEPGHVNIWGKKVPLEPPYALDTADDYKYIIGLCEEAGATISLNHPFCSNCPFRLDMEAYPFDCVEVWNTIQHSDNIKNMQWWHNQLLKGNHIAAVGGSDFHRDYGIPFLACPTTYVNAKSKTEEDILAAMREGRCTVTNSPKSTTIFLHCGEAEIGDTVKLSENKKLEVRVSDFKKGHTLKVYNNDKIIFESTAQKTAVGYIAEVDIEEPGFVRAEITYRFNPIFEKIYAFVERKFLSNRGVKNDAPLGLPDFFWAFTNPIWVEE